ncbi:MAG: type II toxin-antitoxin system RelE/ParE family toxin [Deltaproteobacteria bacterium]|nr:type II toxin-antitoxin system RelE/ParE family toxin [Deltaproteobacteria bacterium]
MSSYYFTPAAIRDLTEIYDFIAEDNTMAASRQLDAFEEKCQLLADSPGIGRKREDLANDLRSFPIGSYIIFYRLQNTHIQIIRILHAARDISSDLI